jgi:carbonic anhydrase
MGNQSIGFIDNWIRHIKMFIVFITLFRFYEDETERFNAFVEINAKEQVYDLSKTSIVQAAWKNGQDLSIHGWVYG